MPSSSPPAAHLSARLSVPEGPLPRPERGVLSHVFLLAWMQTKIVFSYLWLFVRSRLLRWRPSPGELSAWHRRNARRFKETASRLKGANVKVGQIASIRLGNEIEVSGEGRLPPILDGTGRPLSGGTMDDSPPNLATGGPDVVTRQADTAPLGKIDIELQLGKALPPLKVSKRSDTDWMPIGIVVAAGVLLGGAALLFRRILG